MEHENFSDKSCRFGIISKIFAPSKKLLKIMEKIFIYDRYGLELLSCQFAGVSEEGKPQLVITTPGKVVESLDDYTSNMDGYLMLCGGEKMAESKDVMRLLGCVFEGGLDVLEDSVKGRVEDMKRFGIDWKRESVNLAAIVREYEYKPHDIRYSLRVVEGSHDPVELAKIDYYDTVDGLFDELREFFTLVEETTGIMLNKRLVTWKEVREKARKEDLGMFSKVEEIGCDC